MQWKLLYSLWLIRLFRPEWLVSHYVPGLSPLRMIPSILLFALACYWLSSQSKQTTGMKWIFIYLIVTSVSAVFAENTGKSRAGVRFLFEVYALGVVTARFANDEEKTKSILRLFLFHFLYLAVWGIIGGGIVKWDNHLNEEDAFGPLMGIGVAYCSQYFQSMQKGMERRVAFFATCICLVGVIAAFARGAFISLVIILIYRIFTSKNKLKNIAFTVLAALVIFIATLSLYSPPRHRVAASSGESISPFWEEMATIFEGTSAGTGQDRKILWLVAWEEFKENPILGVGIHNFGIAAPSYISRINDRGDRYNDPNSIWGRALHNGYFQILSEGGLAGVIVYSLIIFNFMRTNSNSRRLCEAMKSENERYYSLITGLRIGVVAFLLNLFFYDITYLDWLWNFFIINNLLSMQVVRLTSASQPPLEIRGFKGKTFWQTNPT